MDLIYKNDKGSSLQLSEDMEGMNGLLQPFVDFDVLLDLLEANVYHKRAIKIKANILSQIDLEASNLGCFMPAGESAKSFLYAFIYNLELYGNAVIEYAGSASKRVFYNLPVNEFRLNAKREIFQFMRNSDKKTHLEGVHLKLFSPHSRYYGEPDYLAAILQIGINQQADLFNKAFFDNGGRPDLAIIHENARPTDEQIAAYKEFFSENFKGANNAHRTLLAYTESSDDKSSNIRFEELGKINDLSFEHLKAIARDEIAAAHGIPPRLLGIITSGQLGGGSELISQLHMFNELEIKPKIELIEGFFETIGVRLVLKELDSTSFKDDGDIVTNLVSQGIISVNEARDILGWSGNRV